MPVALLGFSPLAALMLAAGLLGEFFSGEKLTDAFWSLVIHLGLLGLGSVGVVLIAICLWREVTAPHQRPRPRSCRPTAPRKKLPDEPGVEG